MSSLTYLIGKSTHLLCELAHKLSELQGQHALTYYGGKENGRDASTPLHPSRFTGLLHLRFSGTGILAFQTDAHEDNEHDADGHQCSPRQEKPVYGVGLAIN
jgi:hypothetical protein